MKRERTYSTAQLKKLKDKDWPWEVTYLFPYEAISETTAVSDIRYLLDQLAKAKGWQ